MPGFLALKLLTVHMVTDPLSRGVVCETKLTHALYSHSPLINPRHNAQAKGYYNHIEFFLSVYVSVCSGPHGRSHANHVHVWMFFIYDLNVADI